MRLGQWFWLLAARLNLVQSQVSLGYKQRGVWNTYWTANEEHGECPYNWDITNERLQNDP